MLSLSDAVICYAGHCDQLHKLGMLVERVANKHVSFGVEKEHYPVVGAVLLQTLEVSFINPPFTWIDIGIFRMLLGKKYSTKK